MLKQMFIEKLASFGWLLTTPRPLICRVERGRGGELVPVGNPWLADLLVLPWGLLHKCFTVSLDLTLSYIDGAYLGRVQEDACCNQIKRSRRYAFFRQRRTAVDPRRSPLVSSSSNSLSPPLCCSELPLSFSSVSHPPALVPSKACCPPRLHFRPPPPAACPCRGMGMGVGRQEKRLERLFWG